MIRTLVVDDDFRVAQIHADRVSRVEGFVCVGTVNSAAAARVAIDELRPDLMLLDIYLPDENGLSLLRSMQAMENAPDSVIITAARDLATVRAAMRAGAIYYLVKPFGFEQLRRELDAYRKWRTQLVRGGSVDQAGVDSLYELLHGPGADSSRGRVHPTMQKVLDTVRASSRPVGASEIASSLGMSRPTAQRYLTDLERRGVVELKLEYGATGRPVNWYVARRK